MPLPKKRQRQQKLDDGAVAGPSSGSAAAAAAATAGGRKRSSVGAAAGGGSSKRQKLAPQPKQQQRKAGSKAAAAGAARKRWQSAQQRAGHQQQQQEAEQQQQQQQQAAAQQQQQAAAQQQQAAEEEGADEEEGQTEGPVDGDNTYWVEEVRRPLITWPKELQRAFEGYIAEHNRGQKILACGLPAGQKKNGRRGRVGERARRKVREGFDGPLGQRSQACQGRRHAPQLRKAGASAALRRCLWPVPSLSRAPSLPPSPLPAQVLGAKWLSTQHYRGKKYKIK